MCCLVYWVLKLLGDMDLTLALLRLTEDTLAKVGVLRYLNLHIR
jgi:hypothetical protein